MANCAAATGTSVVDDQIFDNQMLCYQARAAQLGDWQSCLQLHDDPAFIPARCLEEVTRQSATYLCANHPNAAVIAQCNQLLMTNLGIDPTLHQLAGLATYRVESQITLAHGADLTIPGQPPTLTDEGLVRLPDYYPATDHLCHPHEAEPIPLGTGRQGVYIYVTGCVVTPTGLTIAYFTYTLPGITLPDALSIWLDRGNRTL